MPKNNGLPPQFESARPEVLDAYRRITSAGFFVSMPSPYHLKCGPANFFPTTRRITIDPSSKHPAKGADAFVDLLKKMKLAAETGTEDTSVEPSLYEHPLRLRV